MTTMSGRAIRQRTHRALVKLRNLWLYETYGPLIGPKKEGQPDPRWEK